MLKVIKGDITQLAVDAIINAANSNMWMKAGVAAAVKRAGGADIEEEAVTGGPVPVGGAVITGAGLLQARYIIHAAVMGPDLVTDEAKVCTAVRNALRRAEELGLKSIAFPALGAGAGGLDFETAARIMVSEVRRHLAYGSILEEVLFVLYEEEIYHAFALIAARDKVVCLGDSITYGFPFGPEASWVRICSEKLGLKLINRGINGNTTRQMHRRFEKDVTALKPAFVIIMGGSNDAWVGAGLEKFEQNIEVMVDKAFAKGICPVLGLPVTVNFAQYNGFLPGDMAFAAGELESYRSWLGEFAVERSLPVLDFYTPLINPDDGMANPDYFEDENHPNRDGYRVLAGAAEPVLLKLKKGLVGTEKPF
jgi:O-acetyl-ADP-ribose deacetylase (regulator of RNase III)